jgi:hypothetical protein
MARAKRYRLVAPVAALLSVMGCAAGDHLSRVLLSGAVTYDGKPVEKGQIRFIPQEQSGGPITIASIDGGRYTTEATGGVPVGAHRVEVKGYDAHEYQTAPTGPGSPPVKQLLPDKYNRESTLTASVQDDSDGRLDFNLDR